ncbi:pyrroline-5-carboxylate reductase family protein [Amycolatopsis jejuensis]|uniref:pyrroline-5-carboxylate reductase family protein n=1 Tax=Amycolatopsis jejuensis TaxID=330084 RepID=UPI0006898C56|nr:pyrroline-5-carboxylate reductase dimerization domain-containing protein [Amycolatopsis jejuensis]
MIGFIGAGSMATAMARGWGGPVLASDSGSGRAAALVEELGGEAFRDNAALAAAAEVLVLAHRPGQLREIAASVDAAGKMVISVLGPTTTGELRAAYPESTVVRTMPNTAVQMRRGVIAVAEGGEAATELLSGLGRVVVLPEHQMNLATATSGVMPAYIALVAEAAIDASMCYGLPEREATEMFLHTLAGTAELLLSRGGDTIAARREVASPGESTVRGVAMLERRGLRSAFNDAARAVLERLEQPYPDPATR